VSLHSPYQPLALYCKRSHCFDVYRNCDRYRLGFILHSLVVHLDPCVHSQRTKLIRFAGDMSLSTVFLTMLRMCQFVSYVYTAFAFVKHSVLPTMRLTSDLAKTRFAAKNPSVNWPGRTDENRYQSKLVSPQEGVGPFQPRYRRDDLV